MFMFSSLAFVKRYVELRQSTTTGKIKSRGYMTNDWEMVASMGPAAGYMAVLVLCLYIDSSVVVDRYRAPMVLWFLAPVLMYWNSRVWFLAHRGQMQDDPVKSRLPTRAAGCARRSRSPLRRRRGFGRSIHVPLYRPLRALIVEHSRDRSGAGVP